MMFRVTLYLAVLGLFVGLSAILNRVEKSPEPRMEGFIDEAFIVPYELSEEQICRICSCGVRGRLCKCDEHSQRQYVDSGRNSVECNGCTLPACNSTMTNDLETKITALMGDVEILYRDGTVHSDEWVFKHPENGSSMDDLVFRRIIRKAENIDDRSTSDKTATELVFEDADADNDEWVVECSDADCSNVHDMFREIVQEKKKEGVRGLAPRGQLLEGTGRY